MSGKCATLLAGTEGGSVGENDARSDATSGSGADGATPKASTQSAKQADSGEPLPRFADLAAARAADQAAAKWLLGVAAAFMGFVVGGLSLTSLGGAKTLSAMIWATIAALVALVAAAAVVFAAAQTMRMPFAQLHEVIALTIPESDPIAGPLPGTAGDLVEHRDELEKLVAHTVRSMTRAQSVNGLLMLVSQARTGLTKLEQDPNTQVDVGEASYLGAEGIKRLRRDRNEIEEAGRAVVALANRYVHERRFDTLLATSSWAAIVILLASAGFVMATQPARDEVTVAEATAVTVYPGASGWPDALGNCAAPSLEGIATAGSWPNPVVVLPGRTEGCPAAIVDDQFLIILPEGVLEPDSSASGNGAASAGAAVVRPARVNITIAANACTDPIPVDLCTDPWTSLDGWALAGTWPHPSVAVAGDGGEPAFFLPGDEVATRDIVITPSR